MERYHNRSDAGKILAELLKSYANRTDVIVLALPRGGVPVAYEIAKALKAPLDVFIVRKLGVPGHEELAMGAIAMGGATVFNQDILTELRIDPEDISAVIQEETEELKRRELLYRGKKPFPDLAQKTIILVDDGIATGATMRAALKALRPFKPTGIIIAVPVAAKSTIKEMAALTEKVICPLTPPYFNAVGSWYEIFDQTSDQEVHQLLGRL